MAAPSLSRRLTMLALAAMLSGVLFSFLGQPLYQRFAAGENDFLQLYAGARLVGTPELYQIEASKRIHVEVVGTWYHSVFYTRLPWYALVLKPLGWLPYLTAYRIWIVFNLVVAGAWLLTYSWQWEEFPIFAALSIPLMINFANGQDSGLVAALCGFAVVLMRRDRPFTAGLLLALCSIKFHLLILVPVVVLIYRRWRLLQGALAGGAALFVLSVAADGFDWPRRFLAMVSNPELHPGPQHMTTFRNPVNFLTGGDNLILENLLNAALFALFAYVAWRVRSFEIAFGIALSAGLVVCHHAYSQDLVVQLASLGILATAGASRRLHSTAMIVALPTTVALLLWGWPYSVAVSLLLASIVVVALTERHDVEDRARSRGPAA